jgi:hypothetical protein
MKALVAVQCWRFGPNHLRAKDTTKQPSAELSFFGNSFLTFGGESLEVLAGKMQERLGHRDGGIAIELRVQSVVIVS